MTGLKWTHKSIRKLSAALRRRGLPCGHGLVARLLRERQFSLRTNRKRLAGTRDPQRDRQFRYLGRVRRWYLSRGLPVISVDTKKKELVGNFKNPGRCWRRDSRAVLDHDFPSWASGRGIPYGIYDVGRDAGYVVLGTSRETGAFAVRAIRRWWLDVGRHYYASKRRLLIQADSGGAKGCRPWAWKAALQALADEFGLVITVMHYPQGGLEVEPDRTPDVQPHQPELGRRAVGELRSDVAVHPQDALDNRVPLQGPPGYHDLCPRHQNHRSRAGGHQAQATPGPPALELHHLATDEQTELALSLLRGAP
jgi:hypothetical protein